MDVSMALDLAWYVYVTLMITGLSGNLWVLVTVVEQLVGRDLRLSTLLRFVGRHATGTRLSRPRIIKNGTQTSAYIYLIVLSIVDILILLTVPILLTDMRLGYFIFPNWVCKVMYFSESGNKCLSPFILTALSIDRYIAVCRPTLVWMRQTRFALFVVGNCLALAALYMIPVVYAAGVQQMEIPIDERMMPKCSISFPPLFEVCLVMGNYLLPIVIIFLVYISILRTLYRHTRVTTVGRKTSISLSRVVKCSVLVVAFYFCCWTPYWALRMYVVFTNGQQRETDADPVEDLLGSDATTLLMEPTTMPSAITPLFTPSTLATTVAAVIDNSWTTGSGNTNSSDCALIKEGEPIPFECDGNAAFRVYMLHALPYTQAALNWLFYAFLNRNLRQTSARCSHALRSHNHTSTLPDGTQQQQQQQTAVTANGGQITSTTSYLWKNLQQLRHYASPRGSQQMLFTSSRSGTASASRQNGSLLKHHRLQSHSSTCIDAAPTTTTGSGSSGNANPAAAPAVGVVGNGVGAGGGSASGGPSARFLAVSRASQLRASSCQALPTASSSVVLDDDDDDDDNVVSDRDEMISLTKRDSSVQSHVSDDRCTSQLASLTEEGSPPPPPPRTHNLNRNDTDQLLPRRRPRTAADNDDGDDNDDNEEGRLSIIGSRGASVEWL